ncbi:SAM-dependent DNA methyltransferase [Snodgrassella sp. ESL0323]|uniref:class I SAM-dependent DNA methyltransferase n=1 Tax=Snodgrassella sp. ESL0323 TaxID=2705034 RepID=UPI001582C2F0|nr:class I SAM-dependent DNA methyltransferase [Snodgrassella sp. ESL0323]NUF79113.1 SAM-dependent DNA methyltransferase [Snodgrassella sp. ESL0323]
MVTGDHKSQIDSIWDTFWSAGLTSSIAVLEQMTYLFFIKMLDDSQLKREANAQILGGTIKDPIFKKGELWQNIETKQTLPYENLRWHKFKNFNATKMFNIVRNDVFVFIKTLGTGKDSVFSRYMANAIFMIPNERTLSKIVDGIDNLDMNDKDTMGDVYEYILGKMAASGTNGQFRTPRHIIRMMVQLMKPTIKDNICDPAMGSAGFIVESATYISEHYKKELARKENAEHYKNTMFHGFDTDQTMLRIGAMNMMLHGVDNPNINYQDSLSEDNQDKNLYSLVLANPPFTGSLDYEVVDKSLLTITKTKKTELLFLSLFTRILKSGGRCASIVPDGVLFGSSKAHLAIRKELVDNQQLEAIISMPSGVFKPYSGVSTAILIFTKTDSGGTDKVWFYDMRADGYSLDDKRSPIEANDIPDIIARYNGLENEANRTRKEQSFFVSKAEIVTNDYDLTINKYKEVERVKIDYEKPELVLARIKKLQIEIDQAIASYEGLIKE